MNPDLAQNFLVALSIGALIGIEREKKKDVEPGHTLGLRTNILLALVGAAAGWLSREMETVWILVGALLAVSAAIIAGYITQNRKHEDAHGLTSEIAGIAVCLLGAMATIGYPALAVALAVATSAILAFKQPLHGLVGRMGSDDIFAGIKLLIASFIVLPLLPDAAVDPWGAINPYKLWLLVILISGLSLLGYVAIRAFGTTHGTAITGLMGGLVSSTATTLNFTRASREQAQTANGHALSAGILLAWLVMFIRTTVLVGILNPVLLSVVSMPLALMGAATAAFGGWHYRAGLSRTAGAPGTAAGGSNASEVPLRNPFSLGSAVQFGALFAIVLLAVTLAQENLPGVGVYIVSALAGSVDVDAITLSLAKDAGAMASLAQAGNAICIAALANTAVKCGMVAVSGAGAARRQVAVATGGIFLAGGAWLWGRAMV